MVFLLFSIKKTSHKLLDECKIVLLLTPAGPWNPNINSHSKNEDSMSDCKGELIEKKDRIRMLVPDTEENKMMEASAFVRKDESSLTNRLCHESHSEHRSIHGNLAELLDGYTSTFKMPIGSTNPLINECLDDASIGASATEQTTYGSGAVDSLEVDNDLVN